MTEEQIKQKAEAEADKVIIGSGMDRASVIHLKHLLVTMYMQGATEVTKELEKENAELKEKYAKNITDCDICDTYCNSQLTKAKDLLKQWVELFKPKGGNIPPTPIQVDTEQFLKEVEK